MRHRRTVGGAGGAFGRGVARADQEVRREKQSGAYSSQGLYAGVMVRSIKKNKPNSVNFARNNVHWVLANTGTRILTLIGNIIANIY